MAGKPSFDRAAGAAAAVGWGAAAAVAIVLLASSFRLDYVAIALPLALAALACAAAWRPAVALQIVAIATPAVGFVAHRWWNPGVRWAEAIVIAAAAGWCARAAVRRRDASLGPRLSVPALVFAGIVVCSAAASLLVDWQTMGPAFRPMLMRMIARDYFVAPQPFAAVHAALLLLEGLLLFVVAARVAREVGARRIGGALVVGGAIAAAADVWRLLVAAVREPTVAGAVDRLVMTRLNVHYSDLNAAGSGFVMIVFAAAGLAATARGTRRAGWIAAAVVAAAGLWISGSRAAMLAGIIAGALALAMHPYTAGRTAAARAPAAQPGRSSAMKRLATAGFVTIVVVIALAVALPERGNQKSSTTAVRVRAELVRTGGRMIAAHPLFGVGLAGFQERSGEFSSAELLAAFPPAVHENAHNNVVQVTAELGLLGGAVFVWLVGAALVRAGGIAVSGRDPFALAAFGALFAFVLTWLGGHPLLVHEPAYAFWMLLGASVAAPGAVAVGRWWRALVAAAVIALVATIPARVRALRADVELEHRGFGLSAWQPSGDVERYRTAVNTATLFVPSDSAFRFRVKPLTASPVRLELTLDGRVADVVVLAPDEWTLVTLPARTARAQARSSRLDLRLLTAGDRDVTIRIGKVERVGAQ